MGKTAAEKAAEKAAADAKPKRVVRRKPLWLAIPAGFHEAEIVDGAGIGTGQYEPKPSSYRLIRCASKADVTKVLNEAGIDITSNEILAHIQMWRADPLPLKLTTQVTIKF